MYTSTHIHTKHTHTHPHTMHKQTVSCTHLHTYSTAGGKVSPCLTVSHGIPQITTGDIVSRQFCGNHPCLKISVIIPGRQPCPMVITEIFRNGPYYHGTQYVPWEFVGHRGIPWDTGNFTTGSTVHTKHTHCRMYTIHIYTHTYQTHTHPHIMHKQTVSRTHLHTYIPNTHTHTHTHTHPYIYKLALATSWVCSSLFSQMLNYTHNLNFNPHKATE